ncbi:MFS transporter [Demetria terragena]|uniref:MFS transporter n=1 Tax=Demetria terragena TaxID=63959 RepID=UPI0003712FCB|nr:MFS transporter [Demetria terragena]
MAIADKAPEVLDPNGEVVLEPRRAWSITIMVTLLAAISFADKAVLGIVARPMAEDIGLTNADIGFMGSAFYATFLVTALVGSLIADRLHLTIGLAVLAVTWSIAQLPVLIAASFAGVLASRLMLGFFEGPASAMCNGIAFSWFPAQKRGLPAAFITSGTSIAKIALAPALTLIVAAWGWKAAFVAMAIVGLVWTAVWLLIGKEGPYAARAARAAALKQGQRRGVPLLMVMKRPTFWGGLLGMFALYAQVAVILTWLPSYLEEGLGYSRVNSGLLFALPSVSGMAIMLLGSYVADRLSAKGATERASRISISAVVMTIGGLMLVAIPFVPGSAFPLALVVVGYGMAVLAFPLMIAVVSYIAPDRQVASIVGLFVAIYTTGGLVGPWLTGMLVDGADTPVEGYGLAFMVFGLASAAGGVLLHLTAYPERDRDVLAEANQRIAAS